MTDAWIRVAVQPDLVKSERTVSFTVPGSVSLVVDEHDLDGDLLRVAVLSEDADSVTVRLPRETPPKPPAPPVT